MATHKVEYPTHDRPSTDVGVLKPVVIALVLTVVFLGLVYVGLRGTFIRDLFMGSDKVFMDRLVFQALIVFVFFMSVGTAVLKLGRIKAERGVLDQDPLPDNLDLVGSSQGAQAAYQKVGSHPKLTDSLALTRMARVLAMWINTEDFERTHQLARNESELDSFASDSSFRANRLFIWALPVLGFIGTVYGVSLAVSGFASFLQGAVTPEQIKVQVGEITTGLGVAFYTTLLGLISATISAFPSLGVEKSEEQLLESIDSYVEDRLVSHMPSAGQQGFSGDAIVTAMKEGFDGLQSSMKFPVDELAQAIDAGFRRLPNPDRYEEVFSRAIAKAGDLINQKYAEFQTNYERRIGELSSEFGSKLSEVTNGFSTATNRLADDFNKAQDRNLERYSRNEEKLAAKFDELTESIATLGKDNAEQFADAHKQYLSAINDLDRREIARWEKMVGEFNQLSERLAEQFRQAVSSLDNATQRYSERVQGSADALSQQLQNVQVLGQEIDKVLKTTSTMEATLRQVSSSDEFRQTLSNLRTHLTTSDELLKQLSKPRKVIFQEAREEL